MATDESGSDSDGGSSSSSFSSLGVGEQLEQEEQEEGRSRPITTCSGLDPASVYRPPEITQVRLRDVKKQNWRAVPRLYRLQYN